MKKMISSLFAAMMAISILPLCVQEEEAVNDVITEAADEVFEAEEDASNEAFQDIAGTSSGNETIVDDAFMNVWLGILFNGYYEYRTYIDDNCDKVLEIRLVPEEGCAVLGLHLIDEEGNSTFFGEKGEGTFAMPEGSVRVEADFISTECENGSFLSAELHDDGGGLF